MVIRRGQVWWADLGEPVGSAPGYRRPVVVVQANRYNESALRTVIVAVITSNLNLASAPGNTLLAPGKTGLNQPSVVNVTQLATIDRTQLLEHVGHLPIASELDMGLRTVLGL